MTTMVEQNRELMLLADAAERVAAASGRGTRQEYLLLWSWVRRTKLPTYDGERPKRWHGRTAIWVDWNEVQELVKTQ